MNARIVFFVKKPYLLNIKAILKYEAISVVIFVNVHNRNALGFDIFTMRE